MEIPLKTMERQNNQQWGKTIGYNSDEELHWG